MGEFMKEYDVFIPSFFELINLRFAPRLGTEPEWFGGIDEVAELQREFQVFQAGRTFQQSAALLGLGGHMNARSKPRWFALLADLVSYDSNLPGQKGDPAIVRAIIDDLALPEPMPVFFRAHDSRVHPGRIVVIGADPRPLFYVEQDYLTISIPMKPRTR